LGGDYWIREDLPHPVVIGSQPQVLRRAGGNSNPLVLGHLTVEINLEKAVWPA
jgi:hypothetical protein